MEIEMFRDFIASRRHVIASLAALVLASATIALAGQTRWEKKPWQKWSKDDCSAMLQNSPWARTWSAEGMVNTPIGQSSEGTGREQVPEVYYLVQFRSALPVRQAVVREAQIENKYDKMDPAHKKTLDDSAESYLARDYSNDIVVHLDYGSNVTEYERDLRRYWQSFASGVVPQETYLINANGKKAAPVKMEVAPGGENAIEFFFPRRTSDGDFIQPGDKIVALQFMTPAVGTLAAERAYVQFDPRKMAMGGRMVY